MNSFITSYAELFGREDGYGSTIKRIEIPLIQRDYAQGRRGSNVDRIRDGFLSVLHDAVASGEHLHLDFVYVDVRDGILRPLDGQQRLTTLFLLHWYLAYRAARVDEQEGWKAFGYAVRPTARLFCERLVKCKPPEDVGSVSTWLEDQSWFLHTWQQDPTIQAMLVMLDAMHELFRGEDCSAAWERLTSTSTPVITFHVLPMREPQSGEDLYIKMNSRGKPLTAFENFKALFERTVAKTVPDRVEDLALKIDGSWSDILWPYRGDDQIIDDEFLRCLHFVSEVCEWQGGRIPTGHVETLAQTVFGPERDDAETQLEFLFEAFDAWRGVNVSETFRRVFSPQPEAKRVVLFGLPDGAGVDLFGLCCARYGEMRGKNRVVSIPLTILLYGVLLNRIGDTDDFPRRVRILRNLVESSGNEIRLDRMPSVIEAARQVIEHGMLGATTAFNKAQVTDEISKKRLLEEHPQLENALFAIEDHTLLRGNVTAFELDATTLGRHAEAFAAVFVPEHWPALTGALLTQGDYSRSLGHRTFRFGSPTARGPWAEVLSGKERRQHKDLRAALGSLLDRMAGAADVPSELKKVQSEWLTKIEQDGTFDWRYYLVKYDCMREGGSGIYVSEESTMGYRLCMLRRRRLNSYYRDPYLHAVHKQSGVGAAIDDAWFMGYADRERWMQLSRSGTGMRCVDEGFLLRPPPADEHLTAFEKVLVDNEVGADRLLRVPQDEVAGRQLDTQDRVQLGAQFIKALVEAWL